MTSLNTLKTIMYITFIMSLLFQGIISQGDPPQGNKKSPRDQIIKELKKFGCSNRLLANQIIDAYKNRAVTIAELNASLRDTTYVDPTQFEKWYD